MKKLMVLAALVSTAAAPAAAIAAPANPAQSLSIARSVRAGAVTPAKKSRLVGPAGGLVLAGVIAAGVAAILIVDGSKDDDDSN